MSENELRQAASEPETPSTSTPPLGQFGSLGDTAGQMPGNKDGRFGLTEPSLDDIAALRQEHQASDGQISTVTPKEFAQLTPSPRSGNAQSIDLLLDVTLPVSIELGRTKMSVEDVLNLGPGSVVELDKLAGEPVDLLVNEKLIARGEVVVVDENFGIRITSMVSPQDRLKSLR